MLYITLQKRQNYSSIGDRLNDHITYMIDNSKFRKYFSSKMTAVRPSPIDQLGDVGYMHKNGIVLYKPWNPFKGLK